MSSAGRRRVHSQFTAEDQALSQMTRGAEDKLARRRQQRLEARQIRIRELERQQREADEEYDRQYERDQQHDAPPAGKPYLPRVPSLTHCGSGSSLSKKGSASDLPDGGPDADLKSQFVSLREKYQRAMLHCSALENERAALSYSADLLRDELEEARESLATYKKEARENASEVKMLNHTIGSLEGELKVLKYEIQRRDQLIEEAGLVLLDAAPGEGEEEGARASSASGSSVVSDEARHHPAPQSLHLSRHSLGLLAKHVPDGVGGKAMTLDEKIKNVIDQNKKLRNDLEDAKSSIQAAKRSGRAESDLAMVNGPAGYAELQKESNKQIADVKFKLQEVERENANLQATVMRLESQLKRFKVQSEQSEKEAADLKQANRILKKDLRDKESALDEALETNKHLQNRYDKLKASRKAL